MSGDERFATLPPALMYCLDIIVISLRFFHPASFEQAAVHYYTFGWRGHNASVCLLFVKDYKK